MPGVCVCVCVGSGDMNSGPHIWCYFKKLPLNVGTFEKASSMISTAINLHTVKLLPEIFTISLPLEDWSMVERQRRSLSRE